MSSSEQSTRSVGGRDRAAWAESRRARELDGERVIVLVRFSGCGRTSGLDLGQTRAQGAHRVDGRAGVVIASAHYRGRANAFADLELVPEHRA
jgi:hypothetical protein